MEHTKWKVAEVFVNNATNQFHVSTGKWGDESIAVAKDKEHAEIIVHACNLHDELVGALNELADAWIMAVPAHIHATWSDRLCKVRAVLARAREGK